VGEGHGGVYTARRQEVFVKRILVRLGGDQPLVERYGCEDDLTGSSRAIKRDTCLKQVIELLLDGVRDQDDPHSGNYRDDIEWWDGELNSFDAVSEALGERYPGGPEGRLVSLLPIPADEKRQLELERRRLEEVVSEFCAAKECQPGTVEMLAALDDALRSAAKDRENWNNGEVRAEEWAACRHSGAGSETYFDDLNYVNGQLDFKLDLYLRALDWAAKATPLLWAQYQETQLFWVDGDGPHRKADIPADAGHVVRLNADELAAHHDG